MHTATVHGSRPLIEVTSRFACFGTTVAVIAAGEDEAAVHEAIGRARTVAQDVHTRLTRFEPGSELSRLNADQRRSVPAGPLLRRLASAARWAGELTEGLVDATCLPAVEAAGYREHFDAAASRLDWHALNPAPLAGAWRTLRVDGDRILRPVGVRLDSGGLAKGLAADLMAHELRDMMSWVVDCAGDLRLGGIGDEPRTVFVADPLDPDGAPIHELQLRAAAVATSGVTHRVWAGGHHLIDPRTGAPADTGVLQVTALAPTGLLAEVRAKAALLSGVSGAAAHLPDGGVLVADHGVVQVLPTTLCGADR
ncbi:MAG: FAD:protein transferase [Solirubrobacterales bacterium]|nr:FAD:protein transferase [Solirubrobacterales bacterium]